MMDDDDDTPARSAADAFDDMGRRLTLLERAVQGLAAERQATPDYTETLGQIVIRLDRHRDAINTLGNRPAMKLTVATIAEQVVAAADDGRKADAETIREARKAMEHATAGMAHRAQTARTVADQKRHVLRAIGITAGATVFVMSLAPGVVSRELPARWLIPERIAARVMRLDRWTAGERLLATADPQRWRTVLHSCAIAQNDHGHGNFHQAARARENGPEANASPKAKAHKTETK